MSLNIKDPEAHQLAQELATATGETMTEAVTVALRERKGLLHGETKFRRLFFVRLGKTRGEPLLCKGADFSQTDVSPAI